MITRFEKRVVAVILAVILAIPLSGLPSVAVQAEEAENITDAPQPEQPAPFLLGQFRVSISGRRP